MLPVSCLCNIHLDFGICQEFSHVHSAHVLGVTGIPWQLQETAGSHSIFWIFLRNPKNVKTNKSACITCCSCINLSLNHQAQKRNKMKNNMFKWKIIFELEQISFFPFYLLSLASLRETEKFFGKERCSSGLHSPWLHPLHCWGRAAADRTICVSPANAHRWKFTFHSSKGQGIPVAAKAMLRKLESA